MPKGKLIPKKARFVEEYLIDLNAKNAAIRAGYSPKTAQEQGSRLLSNVNVQEAVHAAMAARSKRTHITQDRVLQEIARLGFSDLRKAMTEGGGLLPPQEWDDDTAASISSLEVVTQHNGEVDEQGNKVPERVHKIKTWDKNSALEKLAKHLGMYAPERHDHSSSDGTMTPAPVTVYSLPDNGRTKDN